MFPLVRTLARNILSPNISFAFRSISVSAVNRVREIKETKIGDKLYIEAILKDSDRHDILVKPPQIEKTADGRKPCFLCALELDIKHTDVLILSQFVRSDGLMLPRRVTKLCVMQQHRISTLVIMAHKAGLMPNLKPKNSHNDPKRRRDWRAFNSYFDENTIEKTRNVKRKPKGLFRHLRQNVF